MIEVRVRRADEPEIARIVATHVKTMDDDDTPAEACHRFELDQLLDDGITMLGADFDGTTVGIGAVTQVSDDDPPWCELKSMHVLEAARGNGVAHALLNELEAFARTQGAQELRLETGRNLAAAVKLYRSAGFIERPAFGDYRPHPASLFMFKALSPGRASRPG